MRSKSLTAILILAAVALAAPRGQALDLWTVYQLALHNDPQYQQAMATARASEEASPQALAALLPQVSLTGSVDQANNDSSSVQTFTTIGNKFQTFTGTSSSNTRTRGYTAQLTETLFNWGSWLSLHQSHVTGAEALATLNSTVQSILLTVSQDYFNVLYAEDVLTAQRAAKKAFARQLALAQEQYKVGLSAITAAEQARASYDSAAAGVIADELALTQAKQILQALIAVPVVRLSPLTPTLPLAHPNPDNLDTWLHQALSQNPTLIAARLAARVSRDNVGIQRAAGYPSLNLVLSHGYNNVSGTATQSSPNSALSAPAISTGNSNLIGLDLSWPIYSGGLIASRARQARYEYQATAASAVQTERTIESATRTDFLSVLSEIAQVRAFAQSVRSNRTALKATEAGYKVGTQTMVDVLTARQNLLTAEESYAQSRYNYLVAILTLDEDAGTLTPNVIRSINQYLLH
ncbi:MAG: TolC family outer membrane protein [Gammaproteobacteria bacterium]